MLISFSLGLIASCIFIMLVARCTEIHKVVLGGVAIEFSIVILTSEFASLLGIPLSEMLFVSVFLCGSIIAGFLAYLLRRRLVIKTGDTALMVLVLSAIFILFRLIYPSGLPSSASVDGVGHFMIADDILQTTRLNALTSWYSQLAPELGFGPYPYGYHVVAAFIARDAGLPLIYSIQPFNEFLVAATICITVFLSVESAGCQRKFAPLLVGLAIVSPYTFDLLASGYYAQLMGIFLATSFCWLLVSFINGRKETLVLLSVIHAALWLTYPYFAFIPSATLLFALVYLRRRSLIVPFGVIHLASTVLAFPRVLWFFQTALPSYLPVTGAALPFLILLPLVPVGAVGFIAFLSSARKREVAPIELIVPSLLVAVLSQTVALYALDSIMKYGSYFFLKSAYLAAFSLIAMAGRSFKNSKFSLQSISPFRMGNVTPIILLTLILGNVAFGAFVDYRIVARTERLSLSRPVYDAAVWIRLNVPSNVTVESIAPSPLPFWVFAISHHSPPLGPGWHVQAPPSKNQWLSRAVNGSILVVVVGPEIPSDWLTSEKSLDLSNFVVAFHEANVYVLVFNPNHDYAHPPTGMTASLATPYCPIEGQPSLGHCDLVSSSVQKARSMEILRSSPQAHTVCFP